ncbi:LysR family transcriptional regulator [Thermoanaerobacterium thermosaccharolyticum]|uniref:LysR family transcriptional regulator n=1 Tax=Thermoanaerobacterium thermosaccharolyticum TaxID=1517 RepID=UPI00177E2D05|nr:LysR family transcriptional regulator [Thermoanaerobacterium thermosaccharolyticum]MBE0068367.1 LysR family transcriptional regulator [Thermoanaerobacterium thermosaccharolyticum]MBE0228342.1 LysR family transcriptional regulator [Thermoanaerobacterium thermosaccharolyticum]
MDINSFKYFVKICQNNSFTKTAKELFITQQALSKRIKKLEREIGAPLFNRNSKGVDLTELGKYILPKAKALVKTYDDLIIEINNKVNMEKSRIKIGFAPGTLQILGAKEIIDFEQKHNDINIDIAEFSDVDCEANVLNGNLDLALTVKPNDINSFIYYHLIKEKLVVIANKKNPLASRKSVKFEDLKDERFILLTDTFRIQPVILEHFSKAGVIPNIYFKSSHDLKIAYDFVELNKGIFVFVDKLTHIEEYRNICSIPIDDPTAFWDAGFIVKRDAHPNKSAKKFMNYFLNKYNKDLSQTNSK